jgi:plastocyanin
MIRWAFLLIVGFSTVVLAADDEFALVISEHRFQPETVSIPAGRKIRLAVENRDAVAEEFDSFALNREKVIGGSSKGYIFIGPLGPGRYSFVGEFHAETAHGVIVVE